MNRYQDPEFAELSTAELAQIDVAVSQYESRRRRGETVDFDEFLVDLPASLKLVLQQELIRAEAELLSDWGDNESLEQLALRSPVAREWLRDASLSRPTQLTPASESLSSTIPNRTNDERSTPQVASDRSNDWNERFVIRAELAEGGLGQLFVAHDLELDRDVAIKVLKRQFLGRQDMLARFESEANVTSHLEHPNIVPVYARGRRPCGQPYFAMRLIRGDSLKGRIAETYRQAIRRDRGKPHVDFRSDPAARDLLVRLITVCRAVAYAHHRGWVHRDLKPSNVMVGPFGETVIIDWGLAIKVGDIDQSPVGTVGYMSPEQSKELQQSIHPAADIYSLGCILYCILTNRQPDTFAANQSTITKPKQSNRLVPPAVLRPARIQTTLPVELDAICGRATAIDAQDRYESAESLANDLEAWLADEPTSVVKESVYQRLRRRLRSHPVAVGAALSAVAVSFAALMILLIVVTRGNASLKLANTREQNQTLLAQQATKSAQAHAAVSEQAQQRLMELLRSFVVDVEQELAKVPGSSTVRRQVLTTALNQLSQVVDQFGDNSATTENRALALLSMGDLFLRFGKQDLRLDIHLGNEALENPTDAADHFFQQAEQLVAFVDEGEERSGGPRAAHSLKLLRCKAMQRRVDIALLKGDLSSAQKLADESLKLAEQLKSEAHPINGSLEPMTLLNWWAAVECCGRVWKLSGQQDQLQMLMQRAVSELQKASQQHAENESLARALGMAHVFLGDAAFQARELVLAQEHYQADLEISEAAIKRHPEQIACRRDLAVSLDRIANLNQRQGQVEQAIEVYARGQQLRQRLYDEDSRDQNIIRELFVSHMKLGDAHMLIKQVDLAAEQYASASRLTQQMIDFDPKNVAARRNQSLCAEVMADVCLARGQLTEALSCAEKSLAASVAIQEIEPANTEAARDVLLGHLKVAKVYQAMQDWDKTIVQLKLAIDLSNTTAGDRTTIGTDQVFTRLKLIEVLLVSGDPTAAKSLCQELVPRIDEVVGKSRQDSVWRRLQYQLLTMLGESQLALGEKEPARQSYLRALELTQAMIADGQRVETVRSDAVQIEKQLSELSPSN